MLPATLRAVNPVLSKAEYQRAAGIGRSRNATTFLEKYSRPYPRESPRSLIRSIELRTDFSRMIRSTATQRTAGSLPTIFRTRRANDGNYMEVVVSLDGASSSYPSPSELQEASITLNYRDPEGAEVSREVSRGERTDQWTACDETGCQIQEIIVRLPLGSIDLEGELEVRVSGPEMEEQSAIFPLAELP